MELHFSYEESFGATLIPTILFAVALFLCCPIKKKDFKVTYTRIVWSGLGIVIGIFICFKILLSNNFVLDGDNAFIYSYGILLLGWSIYGYFTSPSKLSIVRKIIKIVCCVLFSVCIATGISPFFYDPFNQIYGYCLEIQWFSNVLSYLLLIALYVITHPDKKKIKEKINSDIEER